MPTMLRIVGCIVAAWLIIKLIGLIAGAITVFSLALLAAGLTWWHFYKKRS